MASVTKFYAETHAPQRNTDEDDESYYMRLIDYWDRPTYKKFAPPYLIELLRQRDEATLEDMRKDVRTLSDFHEISSNVMAHLKKVAGQVLEGKRKDTDPVYMALIRMMGDYHTKMEVENQRHQNVMKQDAQKIEGQKQLISMQSGEHKMASAFTVSVNFGSQPQVSAEVANESIEMNANPNIIDTTATDVDTTETEVYDDSETGNGDSDADSPMSDPKHSQNAVSGLPIPELPRPDELEPQRDEEKTD